MRWAPLVAWTSAVVAVAALVAALVLRHGATGSEAFADLGFALFCVSPIAAGVAIATRRPTNCVGPLVALLGLVPAVDVAAAAWADAALERGTAGGSWGALIYESDWIAVFGIIALLLLLFPDGRPLGRRWRAGVVLAIAAVVVAGASSAVKVAPLETPYARLRRPAHAPGAVTTVLDAIAFPTLMCALALAAVAAVVRFRRSRGIERVQIKWLAAAAILLPVAFVIGVVEGALRQGTDTGPATFVSFLAVYLAVIGAVSVAMLRHGLYDVDRVISRTIAWLIISALLAAGFVAVALVVAVPLGGGSAVGTAVAAVAVALSFDALRRRLQSVVDRRFDRDRSGALAIVAAFGARLRDGRAEPQEIETVLRSALGDPELRLLVWLPEAGVHADVLGNPQDLPPPGPRRVVTALGRGEAPLGLVDHADRLLERPGLLADVLRAAALPVEIARLHCELRGRLEEVADSRSRIVRAGYEERRRLERDLHDGAQQRLVALGMSLRRVQRRHPDAEAARAIDGAVGEITETVRDLREIARGLRPGVLDQGLGPALAELARRTPLDVRVEGPDERLPAEVETAAYYVVCEALANAVKHADATSVEVVARRENGHLLLSVADDGRGGASAGSGGGLAGLADRVAAHGGVVELLSPPGEGTRLEVTLPSGS